MLTVHHLGISQSDRIVWLCEELQIPYQLKTYTRDPTTRLAPAEYKALHPSGTAPVITDGDLVLAESGAIVQYLLARHGGGRLELRADHPDYAQYLYWFHFANGSFMPAWLVELALALAGASAENPTLRGVRDRLDKAFATVEQRLSGCDYFAGATFTAADILMLFPLSTMRSFMPRDLTALPALRRYLQRIAARPAYQRAMHLADPEFQAPMS